jgi:Flp pilus assembly protein TadG
MDNHPIGQTSPAAVHPDARTPAASHGQRGQALVLFALALTVLVAAAGLVVDGGLVFVNRRDAQNAADLGAMAGTSVIAEFHTEDTGSNRAVWDAIDAAVQANGCTPGGSVPCTWSATYIRPDVSGRNTLTTTAVVDTGASIPSTAQGVEVAIERRPPTYLLPVIGLSDWDVHAEARALTASIGAIPSGTLLPIAVDPLPPPGKFQPGSTYIVSLGDDAPGQFSWLTYSGIHNSAELAANLCTPSNPAIDLGDANDADDWIFGDTGKTNSNDVRDCLTQWKGEVVLLPTYDVVQNYGSNAEYHITGFTIWRLIDFEATPHIDNIKAVFMGVGPVRVGANYNGPPCNAAVDPACQEYSFFIGLVA